MVALAVVVLVTGIACAPLPPTVASALCADPSTYVPAEVKAAPLVPFPSTRWASPQLPAPNAELMTRLLGFPGDFTVAPGPVVTVRVKGTDATARATASEVRREFGSAVDIEMGLKRLGGGPGGASACLLSSPRWAVGATPPPGVALRVTPRAAAFRPGASVEADVTITNKGRRTLRVLPVSGSLPNRDCGIRVGQALGAPGSPLALNASVGLPARGSKPTPDRLELGTYEPVVQSGDETPSWTPNACPLPLLMLDSRAIPPGESATVIVSASPLSLTPGDDPTLPEGDYELRSLIVIDTTGRFGGYSPDEITTIPTGFRTVAVPAVRVKIRN